MTNGLCPPWCELRDGICQPLPVQLNAARFRTRDGRYFRALTAAGGGPQVSTVVPQNRETFLLNSPGPLTSGAHIVLEMAADGSWGRSTALVRVDTTLVKLNGSHGIRFGGPGAIVWVTTFHVSEVGHLGAIGEWTFRIEKNGGGQISTGDEVSLATLNDFYFRTTGTEQGASVVADSTTPFQEDTVFVVEFNHVVEGLGWRPPNVQCQTCGPVTGTVTDAATDLPIAGATVVAQGTNFRATTGTDGRFTLSDLSGVQACVSAGDLTLVTTHATHVPQTNTVNVSAGPGATVSIELTCTNVSGRVIDTTGQPVAGVSVVFVGTNGQPVIGPNGVIRATTDFLGRFVLSCVPQGLGGLWTNGGGTPITVPITVPPEGRTGVEITVGCAEVTGTVTDAVTDQPIEGATVSVFPSGNPSVSTDSNGNFRFACVPPGMTTLWTRKTGYGEEFTPVTAPVSGIVIKLRPIAVSEILIVMDWGKQPFDLDSHLSGPDGQGGRFHLLFNNRNPVPFASLDLDDTTAFGPETTTVRRSPAVGTFVPGEYRYWVHNFSRSTFGPSDPNDPTTVSNAVVTVLQNGVQQGRFTAASASGNSDDDLWHVVNLQIDANGGMVLNAIQTFQPGDENTIL